LGFNIFTLGTFFIVVFFCAFFARGFFFIAFFLIAFVGGRDFLFGLPALASDSFDEEELES